jgi:type IV secretory pathway VirJ component
VPAGCAREAGPTTLDAGRLGTVELYAPEEPPTGFVFLFSDRDGPTRELRRTARDLAQSGTATVLVDLRAYRKGLVASDDGCHYLISEIEELSKREQRELGASGYHSPVLAGVGQGGTLAYAALAQSPAATVAGAVAVNPAKRLETRVALCEGAKASADPAGGFRYAPSDSLPGTYRVAANGGDALVEAIGTILEEGRSATQEPSLEDLPLVFLPAENPGPFFAVIYSGDGGWRDLDKTIGEYLADHGVPTVGVDSLRYFWQPKTPEEVARDLVSILEVETAHGGPAQKAILIGYSFGADILPFVYNRLPDKWRERVVQVSLLGLGSRAPFEFHMSGWLEQTDESALPVLPEIVRMDLSKLQCFYGEEEDDIVCDKPELEKAEVIRTTGSHHFDGDYETLAQRILEAADRRARAQRTTTPVMPPAIKAATSARTKAAASPPGAAR